MTAVLLVALTAAAEEPKARGLDSSGGRGAVEIIRDHYGVPHIFAESLAGACFGQGYCHAEDNLEEMLRGYVEARGAAAKIFGQQAVETDYLARVFHLDQISRQTYGRLDGEARAVVDGFAAGIDRYLADHPEKRPPWFDAVTGLDVVTAAKTYQLRQVMGDARKDLAGVSAAGRFVDEASNMWAVGPAKSKHGEVMLVSDPHLPWQGATRWHEAQLVVGDRWIYGATFFGCPGIGLGFTQDLAWGSTNNGADLADVYRVPFDPENPNRYRYDDQWREITTETVRLEVRQPDGTVQPLERTVRRTHHGPILREDRRQRMALAVRPSGLEEGCMAAGWLGYFHATRIADLDPFFDRNDEFKWHRIVADRHGDIAYYYFASTHRRSDNFRWNAPVDGSTSATEWGPRLSWRDMPHTINPASGYLVNCNNNSYTVTRNCPLKPNDYPRHLMGQSAVLAPTTRAYRATELIEAAPKLDFADIERMSLDIKTLTAKPYVDRIVEAYKQASDEVADLDGRLKRAVEMLRNWDGEATTDNRALPILVATLAVAAKAGGPQRAERMQAEQVLQQLSDALRLMEKQWRSTDVPWGRVHLIAKGGLELPVPGAGSDRAADPFTTLFMAGAGRSEGGKFVTDRGSSWLQLVKYDHGQVEAKTLVPYGNSNDPASPHFTDQMRLFAERKPKQALLGRREIESAAESTIQLVYQQTGNVPTDNEAVSPAKGARQRKKYDKDAGPRPDLEDVLYGAHERLKLDLWKAKSDKPAPILVFFHGGGGDKLMFRGNRLMAIYHVTKDDPPILMTYGFPLKELPLPKDTPRGELIHNPAFGLLFKEKLDPLAIENYFYHGGNKAPPGTEEKFVLKHFFDEPKS